MKSSNRYLEVIKPGRIFVTLILSIFLFISTVFLGATAQAKGKDLPREGYYSAKFDHSLANGGFYAAREESQAPNYHSDVDPRRPYKGERESKEMVKRAKKNLENRADSFDKYVDNYRSGAPLGERTRRLGENIQEGANETAENAKNLGKSLASEYKQAGKRVERNVKSTSDNLDDKTESVGDRIRDIARGTIKPPPAPSNRIDNG